MDCKTRNGAPAALRVSSMPALSIQQPYCTVLMMMIITIDTTQQASTRSIISALSPMHTRYIHVCCTRRQYLRPRMHTYNHSTVPPTPLAHLAYFPATQSARAILSTPIMRHPPHVRVHVSTHPAETHKHTSTDDEALHALPIPTSSSQKNAKHFHSRQAAGPGLRRKVKVN
jgi:hypothetical protein